MTYRWLARFLVIVLSSAALPPNARAVEKWADPKLTVQGGLELWLDAGQLNAARQAQGLPALKNGEAVVGPVSGSRALPTRR